MKELISRFPDQLAEALQVFRKQQLPELPSSISQILVCGLGGSGIGGTILAELGNARSRVPLFVSKDYFPPSWMGRETLVIISSYSGNTEETLEVFRQAIKSGSMINCITSGGEVEQIAKTHQIPVIRIPGGHPPRACLGYSFTQLCGIVDHYGIVPGLLSELEGAVSFLTAAQASIMAEAESIARGIAFSMPVIYTSADYEGVAVRMRQQLNENAKMLCWHHVVPEMNHNELVGWAEKHPKIAAIFLRNSDEYYRTSRRMEICRVIIEGLAGKTLEINAKGENRIQRLLFWIHLGDWISWFASLERNMDAMEIDVINRLKADLAALS